MNTMEISLPDDLKDFIDGRVGSGDYGSSSEYVRELIRRDRDRQRLRGLLLEGAASRQATAMDADYCDGLRRRIRGSDRN